jgi:hypothetical protein
MSSGEKHYISPAVKYSLLYQQLPDCYGKNYLVSGSNRRMQSFKQIY